MVAKRRILESVSRNTLDPVTLVANFDYDFFLVGMVALFASIGQDYLCCVRFMAALCNRAGHYIFVLWFLFFLSSYGRPA